MNPQAEKLSNIIKKTIQLYNLLLESSNIIHVDLSDI